MKIQIIFHEIRFIHYKASYSNLDHRTLTPACITFKPLQSVTEVSNKTYKFQHLYEIMHKGVRAHSFSKLSNKILYILLIHPVERTSSIRAALFPSNLQTFFTKVTNTVAPQEDWQSEQCLTKLVVAKSKSNKY